MNPANNAFSGVMSDMLQQLTEALKELNESTEEAAAQQKLAAESSRALADAQKRSQSVLTATITAITAVQKLGTTGNPHFAAGASAAGNLAVAGAMAYSGNIPAAFSSVASAALDLRSHFENLARAASPDKLAFLDKARQLEAGAAGFAAMPAKINEAMTALKTARQTRGMGMFDRFTYWTGGYGKQRTADEKIDMQRMIVAEMGAAMGGKAGVGSAESLYQQVQNAGLQNSPLDRELLLMAQEQLDIQKRQLAELERQNSKGFFG